MRLNGIEPPIGTLLPGIEPLVVTGYTSEDHWEEDTGLCWCGNVWVCSGWHMPGVKLRLATMKDYGASAERNPREVHSVYEHHLLPYRATVFGPVRVIG